MGPSHHEHDGADAVEEAAETAVEQPGFHVVARGGFLMSGIVHVLIGWIAAQIALGTAGSSADRSGAMAMIARAPGGQVLLWAGGTAMVALALWLVLRAWFGARRRRKTSAAAWEAARWLGKAVAYAALSVTVLRFAAGGSSSTSSQTESVTAGLLGTGIGRALLLLLAAVVIGIGIGYAALGLSRRFLNQLDRSKHPSIGIVLRITGIIGYTGKGLALMAVGALLGWAGISTDPRKATGLDGALHTMAGLPEGKVMMLVIGGGLIIFGLYCFLRSRYQDM
ncbi:DUF1206 domain-containing protein [Brachybacterium sp. P6-10-X1]|uniref:DUF1206 domain-containing protein n=1 Tax=Brachybacterium sp. P6-10-X1 TaxID=1903186 RepID=UPI0009F8513D|nr:DUF1206 domain-containing protein [Brachybacterium sp. P6-10-X1]